MNLHLKSPGDGPGVYPMVTRGQDLKHLSFTIVQLGGVLKEHSFETGAEEVSLSFYGGPARVEVENSSGKWSTDEPARESVTKAGPMVYIRMGSKVKISRSDGAARIVIAGALGKKGVECAAIGPDQVIENQVGKDNWSRTVYTHIADNIDAAHLICGETVSRPGGWSSCPPHKHDANRPPVEVPMEEIYYFQIEPKQGFGFMRVYSDPGDSEQFDHAYAVEHGDTVLIPRGYHPVVACPGYTVHYLWVLAGEGRKYGAWSDDPKHSWIKN